MADLEANPPRAPNSSTLIDAECDETHHAPSVRIDFHPAQPVIIEASYPNKTSEIVALSQSGSVFPRSPTAPMSVLTK